MKTDLLRLDLRLRRRMLLGTALGAAAYLLLIVVTYPTFKNDTSFDAVIAANPAAAAAFGVTGSITSPSGWLEANMYGNIAPLLSLLLTIGYGAAAIAGQDADGLLGLITTLPISRSRALLQKAVALMAVASAVPLTSLIACLLGPRFDLTLDWGALVEVTVALTLLAFDVGAMALWLGALTGSRGAAMGVTSAAAAAAYLLSSMAPVIGWIHGIRWFSPFFWAVGDSQLAQGVQPTEYAALLGLGVTMVIAAMAAFRRLDVH